MYGLVFEIFRILKLMYQNKKNRREARKFLFCLWCNMGCNAVLIWIQNRV